MFCNFWTEINQCKVCIVFSLPQVITTSMRFMDLLIPNFDAVTDLLGSFMLVTILTKPPIFYSCRPADSTVWPARLPIFASFWCYTMKPIFQQLTCKFNHQTISVIEEFCHGWEPFPYDSECVQQDIIKLGKVIHMLLLSQSNQYFLIQ